MNPSCCIPPDMWVDTDPETKCQGRSETHEGPVVVVGTLHGEHNIYICQKCLWAALKVVDRHLKMLIYRQKETIEGQHGEIGDLKRSSLNSFQESLKKFYV